MPHNDLVHYICTKDVSAAESQTAQQQLYKHKKLILFDETKCLTCGENENHLYVRVGEVRSIGSSTSFRNKDAINCLTKYVNLNFGQLTEQFDRIFKMDLNDVVRHIQNKQPTFLQAVLLCAALNTNISIAFCDHLLIFNVDVVGKYFPIDKIHVKKDVILLVDEKQQFRRTRKNSSVVPEWLCQPQPEWPQIFALGSE